MITPLYWHYEDPDAKYEARMLFPFLYSAQGPRESNVAFFPFYAHFKRYGLSDSTFITPFFERKTSVTGWETNLYPLVWVGRDRLHSHTVVAPFFFDFVTPDTRTTVAFPVYWRFQDGNTVSQLVLNTYYREKKLRSGLDWEVHVFPFFSYGESPNGHFWNVLFGLAGYTRSGAATKMRLFWAPITLSEDAKLASRALRLSAIARNASGNRRDCYRQSVGTSATCSALSTGSGRGARRRGTRRARPASSRSRSPRAPRALRPSRRRGPLRASGTRARDRRPSRFPASS